MVCCHNRPPSWPLSGLVSTQYLPGGLTTYAYGSNRRRVVAPLVLGVPHWDSQRFSTYAQARRHYNDVLAAGLVHVHHE